jgi:hypothetical protein
MATFIKAGFWEKLCKPCKGYKGWLNLDELIQSLAPPAPAPAYKVYTALLSHGDNTNDPTVIVLENTLGSDITWKRGSVGIFYAQNSNFSDATKVWMSFSPNYSNQGYGNIRLIGSEILLDGPSGPTPALWFTTETNLPGAGNDDWGTYIPVEIRIYS